jgi:hypothetical protein
LELVKQSASGSTDIPDSLFGKWYDAYLGKTALHFLGCLFYEIEVVGSLQPFDCIGQPGAIGIVIVNNYLMPRNPAQFFIEDVPVSFR